MNATTNVENRSSRLQEALDPYVESRIWDLLGIDKGAASRAKKDPDEDFIRLVCAQIRVNPEWVLKGPPNEKFPENQQTLNAMSEPKPDCPASTPPNGTTAMLTVDVDHVHVCMPIPVPKSMDEAIAAIRSIAKEFGPASVSAPGPAASLTPELWKELVDRFKTIQTAQ